MLAFMATGIAMLNRARVRQTITGRRHIQLKRARVLTVGMTTPVITRETVAMHGTEGTARVSAGRAHA